MATVAKTKKLGTHWLLTQFFHQGCEILHRSLSETVLLTTSFMTTLHLVTQYSPLCEIAWPEFWAFEGVALAGDRSNRSDGTSYDKAGRRLFSTSGAPFMVAHGTKGVFQVVVGPREIRYVVTGEKSCCYQFCCQRSIKNASRGFFPGPRRSWVPKGGLDTPCSLVFSRVLPVLEMALFCPSCIVFYR